MRYVRILRVILLLASQATSGGRSERDDLRRARDYNRTKERLYIIGTVSGLVTGGLFVFTGLATRLRDGIAGQLGRGLAGRSATAAAYGLLGWLASLPLGFYSGYVVEHRFDLSNQTRRAWAWEALKSLGISLVFEVPVVDGLYAIIRRWPRYWWAIASAISIPLTVLMAQLFPVLIAPLFNKYEPLTNRELAERLKQIAAQSGIRVADVLQMDMSRQTKKANAFFAGLGRTKRIVLADTLLETFTPEEIEVVVAHEIAHQAHRDIWRFIALGTAFTFSLSYVVDRLAHWALSHLGRRIGVRRLDTVATLPLLAWLGSLAGLVLGPLQNAYSRRIERAADSYALRLTRDPISFARAMVRLAEVNLADPSPPALVRYLLYSHPPIRERVEHARRFARENALPVPEPLEEME